MAFVTLNQFPGSERAENQKHDAKSFLQIRRTKSPVSLRSEVILEESQRIRAGEQR